jgi:hypothetical protein
MKPNQIPLSQQELHDTFEYLNGELAWKNKSSALNGRVAGCIHKSGYRQIKLKGKLHQAHRLIWAYHYGQLDSSFQLDHINGVKNDNRIENLRPVTPQENCFHRSEKNSKGYTWNCSSKKWQAHITVAGKNKYLGVYEDEADARNAYLSAVNKHHHIEIRKSL